MKCTHCGAEIQTLDAFCPLCGNPNYAANTGFVPSGPIDLYPMKWYKFVIYFLLFFSAAINLISAILYFTGALYGDAYTARLVYATFPAMKPLDIVTGIYSIGIAVFAIVIRFALSKRKRSGPKMFCAFYVLSAVYNLMYIVVSSVIIGEFTGISAFSSVVFGIVLAVLNYIYFQKRASSFPN